MSRRDLRSAQIACHFDRLWEEIGTFRKPQVIAQFLSNVNLPAGWFENKLCLDVGCGSGYAVWAMRELGARCCACDLRSDSLRAVRARVNDGGDIGSPLFVASALTLPLREGSFDFVHCSGVLHHTTDPRAGFKELVRVTRRRGTLFVSLYGSGGLYNAVVNLGRWLRPVLPYEWTREALSFVLGRRTVPNSFMPAKVSVLDNLYVPIRESYRERDILRWFAEEGFPSDRVVRTRTTIYDHEKPLNRLLHGDGYLQFRACKP